MPEVVEDEGREDERIPGDGDGAPAEVPHVRVQRFPARDAQDHGAERREGRGAVEPDVTRRRRRVQRREDHGHPHDLRETERPDREKPENHHRAEDHADAVGPVPLDHEQTDEDDDGDGDDERRERRRDPLEPLHGAQDRDGRRDDAVPIKERGAEEDDEDERVGPELDGNEAEEGEDSPSPVVATWPASRTSDT